MRLKVESTVVRAARAGGAPMGPGATPLAPGAAARMKRAPMTSRVMRRRVDSGSRSRCVHDDEPISRSCTSPVLPAASGDACEACKACVRVACMQRHARTCECGLQVRAAEEGVAVERELLEAELADACIQSVHVVCRHADGCAAEAAKIVHAGGVADAQAAQAAKAREGIAHERCRRRACLMQPERRVCQRQCGQAAQAGEVLHGWRRRHRRVACKRSARWTHCWRSHACIPCTCSMRAPSGSTNTQSPR
jgi:hypothetical protein